MSSAALALRRRTGVPQLPQGALLVVCAAAAAIWVGMEATGSLHAFAYRGVPVLLVPLALWLFLSERYEVTLAVLLLYLGLADGVVKLASGSQLATLGRDVLLYAIVLGAVVRMIIRKTPIRLPPLSGFVLAWVAVCVVQLANPSNVSFLHAFVSLRQHLEFVPLFFFGYVVLRSERRLTGFLILFLLIAAVNGIVSVIQSGMSPHQLASWGPGYSRLELGSAGSVPRTFVAGGHTRVRPPGLGGEDGFGGMLGLIAVPGAIALLSNGRRSPGLRWLMAAGTVLATIAVVLSEVRLDVVGAALAILAFLALTATSRRGILVIVLTGLVAFSGYFLISGLTATVGNRYASIAPSKVFGTAFTERKGTLATIPAYMGRYPLGAGLGSGGPAAGISIGGSAASRALNAESEFTFLLIEVGIPGLAVMLAFTLVTIRVGVSLRRVEVQGLQRALMSLTGAVIAVTAAWLFAPVTSDSPSAPLIWLAGGCLAYWYQQMRARTVPVRMRLVRQTLAVR